MLFKEIFTASHLFCEQNKNKISASPVGERTALSHSGVVNFTEASLKEHEMYYGTARLQTTKTIHIHNPEDIVALSFLIAGDATIQSLNNNFNSNLTCHQHAIRFLPKGTMIVSAEGCPALTLFEITVRPSFITQFLNENPVFNPFLNAINNGEAASITAENGIISFQMQQIINDIVHTDRKRHLKSLWIESKILELLLLQIEYFDANGANLLQPVHQPHLEKIIQAKNIIEGNTYAPCSLIDLAHMVGTNECTLKKGFKELTGNTVFGYWNDLKMKDAFDLISATDTPIYEVAHQLGYKHAHHFSAAFKKKFQITPADLRTNSSEKAMA